MTRNPTVPEFRNTPSILAARGVGKKVQAKCVRACACGAGVWQAGVRGGGGKRKERAHEKETRHARASDDAADGRPPSCAPGSMEEERRPAIENATGPASSSRPVTRLLLATTAAEETDEPSIRLTARHARPTRPGLADATIVQHAA